MVPAMEVPEPSGRSPEERLLLAILGQALVDARHCHYAAEAKAWLASVACCELCDLVDVSSALVLKLCRQEVSPWRVSRRTQ
jgi:hypothetical protein